ncbi:MAG: 2,3,4,5-tetrahydropyridine-2,6-dicarboxylate N-succinyltransferase [Pseudobdellovibrionaceae bacterium]
MSTQTASLIDSAFSQISSGGSVDSLNTETKEAVFAALAGLDSGKLRVCEKRSGEWTTHQWLKKAILLYFRLQKLDIMRAGDFQYFDKIPVKKWTGSEGVRAVPHALARYGSFVASNAILMPSYVNIGAFVGSGTMVDTWATVGSCAQIGANVHLSGGVGIGGVLEPIQANPVIIEDNCFIGSRCIVVEGAVVEEGAVLGAGTVITASTKIIDVNSPDGASIKGRIPANSVVIPGTYNKKFPAGEFGMPCALIIGKRKASTDLKTSLTDALRDFQVSV